MPTARCKFQVVKVTKGLGEGELVDLGARYSEDDPEDTKFSRWTPDGHLSFHVSNPALLGSFQPGDHYYVDLTPVE